MSVAIAFLWDLIGKGLAAYAAPQEPGAVVVGRPSLTGVQVRALGTFVEHLVTRSTTVADAETVADTIIDAALMAAGPEAAALAGPAATALANLVIERIAAGEITFDPNPIGDGQTQASDQSHGRWQR